jgi:hypothetical protein
MTTNQHARRIAKTAPTHLRFALQRSLHKWWLYVAHEGQAHKIDSVPRERAERWSANTPSAPNPGVAGTFHSPICERQSAAASARSRKIAEACLWPRSAANKIVVDGKPYDRNEIEMDAFLEGVTHTLEYRH